ncbi:hypothetical protein LOK74_03125 [Brevibacillus humidisoli]|uniref:hypothetical protein n=1 Tax=Brevibacillus humidisoli TaxID=2895522 RepID=UPI001E2C0078|nr:hypothetical protein [Brevibacillus humidisoli]UFJ41540.1 hypothetical protein LOK74_03125 [Brevibacillus humidisoli]
MSVRIRFRDITVDSMEIHSAIMIGKTIASNWDSHSKTQEAIGGNSGKNIIKQNRIIIHDKDLIDTIIHDADVKQRTTSSPNTPVRKRNIGGKRKRRKRKQWNTVHRTCCCSNRWRPVRTLNTSVFYPKQPKQRKKRLVSVTL